MAEDWRQAIPPQFAHLADEILSDVRTKWSQLSGGPGVLDSFKAFVAAVDWKVRDWWWAFPRKDCTGAEAFLDHPIHFLEAAPLQGCHGQVTSPPARNSQEERWLQGLLAVHGMLLLAAILLRHNVAVQAIIFFIAGG